MTSLKKLAVGNKAPDFTLLDKNEKPISLSSFRGKKVVLYFYPRALTPGCTMQACDFENNLSLLQGANYTIIGISPDKPAKLLDFSQNKNLNFTLLSDPDKKVLTAYGAYGEKNSYGKISLGVIRSTFLISEDGTILEARYNVKATGHVAKLLKEWNLSQ